MVIKPRGDGMSVAPQLPSFSWVLFVKERILHLTPFLEILVSLLVLSLLCVQN